MKKLFYLIALVPFFLIGCESDDDNVNVIGKNEKPATKVFAQGALLDYSSTRADLNSDQGYGRGVWPNINTEEGWEVAKFSIRIDASFPGVIDQKVAKYWSTKDKVAPKNLGKVYTNFPWGRYNDRNLDYYKVDKEGPNTGMFRYVLDPFGGQVNNALMEVPDMKAYLTWMYGLSNTQYKNKLKEILDNWDDYNLIWYVAKEVGSQYLWHVNGYFKKKSYTFEPDDIWKIISDETEGMEIKDNDVDDNVEVDIHLQEHKDWNEIKTSIHVRTDAESVQVNLPLTYDNIVEADDFAIRIYNYYVSGIEIKNMITHNANGITINITNINPTVIERLKSQFGDGLTIEIHSYCKKLDGVWEELKNSTVTTGNECALKYQITSAYDADDKVVYPEPTLEE